MLKSEGSIFSLTSVFLPSFEGADSIAAPVRARRDFAGSRLARSSGGRRAVNNSFRCIVCVWVNVPAVLQRRLAPADLIALQSHYDGGGICSSTLNIDAFVLKRCTGVGIDGGR